MSDMTTWDGTLDEDEATTEEVETEEVGEAEEPDPPPTETDESDDAEAPTEAPLIFGKYKDMVEADKGYGEAVKKYHEGQQRIAELEARLNGDQPEEDVENTYDQLVWGTALGTDEARQLAEFMISDISNAQGVVEYVQQNIAQFGPHGQQIYKEMYDLWHAHDPGAAQDWRTDQRWAAHAAQIAEQQAPLQSHYTNQMASIAVHRATAELPRFAEFKDAIMETITSPNMQGFLAKNPEYASDPQKMFEVLQGAWTNLIAQEYRTNQQHAASASGEPAPGTPEKAKPRTQQRSTAAPPDSDDEVVGMFPAGTFRTS